MGVQSDAINTLAEVHNRQVQKGLKTYGKPVMPFNGRSAYNDAMEEIVDTAVYVTQLEQERTILKLALESLYGACMRFLDAPDGRAAYPRMRFSEEVRSVREDLATVGFVLNDDADERYYSDSIAALHTHIKIMLDDEDEFGGTIPESAFITADTGETLGIIENTADHPLWDEGWEAGVQGKWPKDNPYFNDDLCKQYTAGELFEFSDLWEAGRKVGFKRHRQYLMDQLESSANEAIDRKVDEVVNACYVAGREAIDRFNEEKLKRSVYDAEDIGEGGCMGDPSPICPKCGDELEWDSGDDSVGWPGQWYCALCDREGEVVDGV